MISIALESTNMLDKKALVGIYERHSLEIYRYAYRLSGKKDLAEECVAETFSRLVRAARGGHAPDVNVRAWLFRVAHNWINDYFRSNQRKTEIFDAEALTASENNPATIVADRMEQARVRKALYKLPQDQRQVIELRFLEQWSHEEVSAALHRSVEATRALQYRALSALRQMLIAEEE